MEVQIGIDIQKAALLPQVERNVQSDPRARHLTRMLARGGDACGTGTGHKKLPRRGGALLLPCEDGMDVSRPLHLLLVVAIVAFGSEGQRH